MDKLQTFVIWLDGYIDAIGEDGFNISKTNVIMNKLHNLFDHEAAKFDDKPTLQELGQQHGFIVHEGLPDYSKPPFNGLGGDEDGVLYRC